MENFINPFYTLKVFDRHEIHELVKGSDKVTKLHSNGWYKLLLDFLNTCYLMMAMIQELNASEYHSMIRHLFMQRIRGMLLING
jgi:hypothetical protein